MMKIIYWSDFTCPWCWIGEARMKKAVESLPELGDVEFEMKAFQLNPNAPLHARAITEVRLVSEDGLTPEQAAGRIQTVNDTARAEGLEFNYGTSLSTNTMDAHRLTKLAQSKGDQALSEKLIIALFKAYFTDNLELSDHTLLQQIGESCGIPSDEVKALLNSDHFREEVIRDEQKAAYYGIHGVPFFVVGRYGISGAQTPEYLRAVLLQAKLESEPPKDTEEGISCGPDGCR